jgi:hypothetical protein
MTLSLQWSSLQSCAYVYTSTTTVDAVSDTDVLPLSIITLSTISSTPTHIVLMFCC